MYKKKYSYAINDVLMNVVGLSCKKKISNNILTKNLIKNRKENCMKNYMKKIVGTIFKINF